MQTKTLVLYSVPFLSQPYMRSNIGTPPPWIFISVPEARVELARLCRRQILSLLGLPFPHSGIEIENKRISVVTFLKSHCDDIPHHKDVQRRTFTYITLLSSPSISEEYCMEAPTLDSQYNKRTQQTSVVTVVRGQENPG